MRRLAACIACLGVVLGSSAHAGGRTQVLVRSQVVAKVQVREARAIGQVRVPMAAAPVVEVPQAATLEVFSNTGGFAVEFQVVDAAVEQVVVTGLDSPVIVGAPGGSAPVQMAGDTRIARRTLHYLVRYPRGTPAGIRPAPLSLSVRMGS
jgi:hypothetical protein